MTSRPVPELKQQLRRQCRQRRRGIDAAQRADWDRQIRIGILSLPALVPGSSLAAYWPFDGEPDLRPALAELHERGHRVCLPIVADAPGAGLQMRHWLPDVPMLNNRHGVPEPSDCEPVPLQEIDVVFMPLVGWDRHGHRLGMGAGYYDRYLAPVAELERPLRVGVAYAVQEVEALPADAWDVPLHGLLSENGWTPFGD
ncbi:MAG TPA: 5-formyltetrahydrofolate cyclo-ligase [Xanthomonadales bacterium]|nr:5-formyltetrahydrofolate cyclo-ligase [Xanthomonadales bacterium]